MELKRGSPPFVWVGWCKARGVAPLPLDSDLLAEFLVDVRSGALVELGLAKRAWSQATVNTVARAVRAWALEERGLLNPPPPVGLREAAASELPPSIPRPDEVVTAEELAAMVAVDPEEGYRPVASRARVLFSWRTEMPLHEAAALSADEVRRALVGVPAVVVPSELERWLDLGGAIAGALDGRRYEVGSPFPPVDSPAVAVAWVEAGRRGLPESWPVGVGAWDVFGPWAFSWRPFARRLLMRALVLVSFQCGLAFTEARALDLDSVALVDGGLDVSLCEAVVPRRLAVRHVTLAEDVANPLCAVGAMRLWLAARGGAPGKLFCERGRRPVTWGEYRGHVEAMLVGAGVRGRRPVGHLMRASAAVEVGRSGLPLQVARDRSGYSSWRTVERLYGLGVRASAGRVA